MNRSLIAGVALGIAVAAVPVLYFNRSSDAFNIDPGSSTMASIPGAKAQPAGVLEDFAEPDGAPAAVSDESRIRQLVRDEIKANPSIVIEAIRADSKGVIEALNTYAEAQRVADEKSKDAQTLAAEPQLTVSKDYPFLGNPDGKVEVYYYFDANCHYCKQIEPELDRFVKENPDVKIVHREMPILADSSRYAAEMAGLLFINRPDRYADFHRLLMSFKPGMGNVDIDMALIKTIGESEAGPIIALARNPKNDPTAQAVAARVSASLKAATDAGVSGTPFIITKYSGLFVRGAAQDIYAQLQSMAAKALESANSKKAAN